MTNVASEAPCCGHSGQIGLSEGSFVKETESHCFLFSFDVKSELESVMGEVSARDVF